METTTGSADRSGYSDGERGVGLVELIVTLAIITLMATFAISASLERTRNEKVRGAAHQIRAMMGVARIQAVQRNHTVRFAISQDDGRMQVIDTMGTSSDSDDVVLLADPLPRPLGFANPGGGAAITLAAVSGLPGVFFADFQQNGRVTGVGSIGLADAEAFARATVSAAGSVRVERWANGAWMED